MNIENYDIKKHKHILAVWSAATAANNSTTFRFSVEFGKELLMLATDSGCESQFIKHIESIKAITSQTAFDDWHHSTILKMINSEKVNILVSRQNKLTKKNLISSNYTYGIAAKLLNVYLKVYFLGDFDNQAFADFIHPPIDRLLLKQLRQVDRGLFSFEKDSFAAHKMTEGLPAWTQLTDKQYRTILNKVKKHLTNNNVSGLWKIEYAWKGHQ